MWVSTAASDSMMGNRCTDWYMLAIYTACAYLARVIRTGSPDSRTLDPIESTLRSFNRTEIKTANPTLDVFLPRIFKEIEDTWAFPEPMIDPSLWLLNPGEWKKKIWPQAGRYFYFNVKCFTTFFSLCITILTPYPFSISILAISPLLPLPSCPVSHYRSFFFTTSFPPLLSPLFSFSSGM